MNTPSTVADTLDVRSLLGDLETLSGDLFERWDKDQRSGKLLTAMSGMMSPGYDPRVDRIRRALTSHTDLLSALESAEDALAEHCPGLTYLLDDVITPAIAKARGEVQP